MWDSSAALALVSQAFEAKYTENNQAKAVALIDEAIELAEQAGAIETVIQWRRKRTLFQTKPDARSFPLLVEPTLAAVEYYTQQKNIAGQIDSLIQLAEILGTSDSKEKAQAYLTQVEQVIAALADTPIDKETIGLPDLTSLSAEQFILLRSHRIKRLQRYLAQL